MADNPKDILLTIHGIVPSSEYVPQKPAYEALWKALVAKSTVLGTRFPDDSRCYAIWGQDIPDQPINRNDEEIRIAENNISDQVATTKTRPNAVLPNPQFFDFVDAGTRLFTDPIKDQLIVLGLTDVVYYCGEGERVLRNAVYGELLDYLTGHLDSNTDLRLHLLCHSLGAAIGHDFLYGLFRDEIESSEVFTREYWNESRHYDALRIFHDMAKAGRLSLGSFVTVGCQLCLFVMRNTKLVDTLFRGEKVDARQIGLLGEDRVVWRTFYDRDDVLGLPVAGLYDPRSMIEEFEVNTSWDPRVAHTLYWTNNQVLEKVADLLTQNSG